MISGHVESLRLRHQRFHRLRFSVMFESCKNVQNWRVRHAYEIGMQVTVVV